MQFNKISLQFLSNDYSKIAYLLPVPTYRRTLSKTSHQGYVIITYELIHSITSENQFRWIANIKQSMKKHIKVEFEFVEYVASENQDNTNIKFTLQELQQYFPSVKTKYPQIFLPSNKKELYQRLCVYASKLYYQKIFYIEMIIFASIKINNILDNPYSHKELLSKSKNAYEYILKIKPKQKLTPEELKLAHKKGGEIRAKQMKELQQQNKEQVKELLKDDSFIKANGKPNITAIAEKLKLNRRTVERILKNLFCFLPYFFLLYTFNLISYTVV